MDIDNISAQIESSLIQGISLPITSHEKLSTIDLKVNFVKLDKEKQKDLKLSNKNGNWLKIELMDNNNLFNNIEIKWADADALFADNSTSVSNSRNVDSFMAAQKI